jgi:hypothetical protein
MEINIEIEANILRDKDSERKIRDGDKQNDTYRKRQKRDRNKHALTYRVREKKPRHNEREREREREVERERERDFVRDQIPPWFTEENNSPTHKDTSSRWQHIFKE